MLENLKCTTVQEEQDRCLTSTYRRLQEVEKSPPREEPDEEEPQTNG